MASASKIVFLIDEQSIICGKVQLDHLKLSIMRILLYYRSQQKQVLWGYRFFSTQTRYSAHSVRHFYTMDKESLSRIDQEYQKRNDDRPETAIIGAPIMRIKQALKEILGDFQWQNTDLSTSDPEQNYLFILTACPSNGIDMIRFFVTPVDDDDDDNDDDSQAETVHTKKSVVESFEVSKYFQRLKDELSTTLLKSYQQYHISLNIIDSDFKFISNNAHTRFMNRLIQQGFVSCFQQFGGNYILYQKLTRRNDLYGHSFFAEFANILPSKRQTAVHAQVPSWKGPFKTKTGKSLGNFALYPSIRGANYQSSALTFIKEIRTVDVIHASQFSVSWLLDKSAKDDYKFTYQQGESSSAFNVILDELYDKQSILIADLVPIVGCEHMARKVCIEPFSRCSASLRFLNVNNLPPILHLKNVLVDQDYPIGPCLATTKVGIEMPKAPLQPEHRTLSLFTILPSFITKLKESHKLYSNDTQMDDQSVGTPEIRVEDVADPVIQLPLTVDLFSQELKKTYLETLYTPETFIDAAVVHIGKCIDYLLQNNRSRQDIVASIFDYTMPLADLDMKHHNEIPNAKNAPNSSNCTLEQTYQYAWWKEIKSKAHASPDFERKSCVALKLREAQLQTINYCFICKLTNDPRQLEVYSRDPFEEARNFFSKVVVIFSMNDDISDFMASLDFEQGAQATKKRDPCTLNDHAFAQVLAKRFNELSDLVEHFKESAGADDMASLSSLDLADDVIDDDDEFQQQEEPQPQPQPFAPLTPSTPSTSSSSKPPRIESRTLSNTRIVKPNHPPKKSAVKSTPSVNLEPKLAKTFMPQKMARSTSNTLDSFYKRMVNVTSSASTSSEPQRGEATKESIAKMKRAAVDGKATMKRAGSFTKSALSPRRPKRTVSMLSQAPQETGTVILRRDNSIPNPETTPRTSLNRYLGTNLFADYSEACPSPTSRTSPTSAATSSAYVQSEYPQAPKTPQGTSSRFRKIMMDRTPHRHDDQSDLEEFSVRLSSQENHLPPYTPRTAARRERDRINRSEVNPGRDLTMKFQIIKKEEEKERNNPVVKRKLDIFADDDDDDDDDDDQENTNPLCNGTGTAATASRPVVKRSKTFDFNDFYNNALDTPPIQFGQALAGIDDDEDDDSDDLDGYFGLGGR